MDYRNQCPSPFLTSQNEEVHTDANKDWLDADAGKKLLLIFIFLFFNPLHSVWQLFPFLFFLIFLAAKQAAAIAEAARQAAEAAEAARAKADEEQAAVDEAAALAEVSLFFRQSFEKKKYLPFSY